MGSLILGRHLCKVDSCTHLCPATKYERNIWNFLRRRGMLLCLLPDSCLKDQLKSPTGTWYSACMSTTIIKVKNNTVTLPRGLGKTWKNADVALVVPPSDDTLILQRIRKARGRLSEIATRNPLPRMSRQAVNREITAYRLRRG